MRPDKAFNAVKAYVGSPGSGKSYQLAARGVEALLAGRRVFSNAGFEIAVHSADCDARWAAYDAEWRAWAAASNVGTEKQPARRCPCPKSERYFSLEELLTVPDGAVILLDEAPVYVNSRKSSEFPRGLLYRVTQVRKDGLELHYSAMDEMMVDSNLRRVTFFTYICRRSWFGFFRFAVVAPVDRRSAKDKPYWRSWYRLRPQVAAAYDTNAKVWVPPEVIDALIADAEKPWLPLTAELSMALLSRDPERIAMARDHAQEVATAVRDEYRRGERERARVPDLREAAAAAESIVFGARRLAG